MRLHRTDMELETIVRRIVEGELDLQPEFQRGEIWDNKRRQRLVDTILRGWYVPAVHIVQDEHGEQVLDGQQRLATIRDFFTDELKIDGSAEPRSDEIESYHGRRFSQLPEVTRRAVRRFPLPVVYLSDYEPGEPNELFFRLNQSYNLTPPEKRNALHGAARNQVKDLVREMESSGLLQRQTVGFSNQRLAYDDIVARTCVAVERNTIRKHINNNVVEDYYREGKFDDRTIAAVYEAGRVLLEQLDTNERIKFNKGTLQTWLIYCHWAPIETGSIPIDLLARFERDRQVLKRGGYDHLSPELRQLVAVLSVYDDRASYRVTDVTSVVARDLAVHLYCVGLYGTEGARGSHDFVRQLMSERPADPATTLLEFADQNHWGDPLVGRW